VAYEKAKGGGGNPEYKDAPTRKLARHGDVLEGELLETSHDLTGQYGPFRIITIRDLDGEVFKMIASKIFLQKLQEEEPQPGNLIKVEREDRTVKSGEWAGKSYAYTELWVDRSRGGAAPAAEKPATESGLRSPAGPVGDDAPPF
jgi:hypothetical protein